MLFYLLSIFLNPANLTILFYCLMKRQQRPNGRFPFFLWDNNYANVDTIINKERYIKSKYYIWEFAAINLPQLPSSKRPPVAIEKWALAIPKSIKSNL